MRLPSSAARQYGITRRALGSFGNASADRRSPIDWSAPTEHYSVFDTFWTRKGANGPGALVSRARWVLPDETVWVSPSVSESEVLGGGIPPCVQGAKRAICGRPPDGTRYPRSTFCECMFGDLQPFRRFCQKAAEWHDPWTHEGLAEMTRLAHEEGYKNFNPWSVPAREAQEHLDWRKVSLKTDWKETVRLTDPLEYNNRDATRFRLLAPKDPAHCPQQPQPSQQAPGSGIGTTPISEAIGGTVLGPIVSVVGGGFTVMPGFVTPLCPKGTVYAVGKDGKQTCAKPEDLQPKKEAKTSDSQEGSNLLPILAAAAAAAFFLF